MNANMQKNKTLDVLSDLIREGFSKNYDPGEVDEALRDAREIVIRSFWQPIETAPKDGTPILVINDSGDMAVCAWAEQYGCHGWYATTAFNYEGFGDMRGFEKRWMPLPPPPEGAE